MSFHGGEYPKFGWEEQVNEPEDDKWGVLIYLLSVAGFFALIGILGCWVF
ncbi:MAG: hypothetical protein LBC64_09245 [Fibromonadaceae bacterium]|jgi:hypothetical protein|nr:hypothetical protein [Fibromonadaceae bacterium]